MLRVPDDALLHGKKIFENYLSIGVILLGLALMTHKQMTVSLRQGDTFKVRLAGMLDY